MSEDLAVKAADDRFFSALAAMFTGDAAPMEDLWSHADDVVYMGPVPGLLHKGWKAIDEDWLQQGKMKLGGSIEVLERHITVGEELAVVHAIAKTTGQDPEDAAGQFTIRGTNVFRKEGSAWKLIAHHSDPLPYVHV